jgi:predicted metal-binding membrane protein
MDKIISFLYFIGALMVLVGSSVYITHWSYAPYIYTVGAGFFALAQINSPYHSANKNVKRLRRQQIIGAVFLVLTGLFMFTTHNNEWIASLTIAAILEIYTTFRISQEEKGEKTV